ncbi:MAG: valine--tRNA ligase [Bacteroidia bacterium]
MAQNHEIPAQYNPIEVEDKWYDAWMEHKLFHSTPDEREPYTIVIPPPNVTGVLHMGHMLNNTIQDVLIRRKRMLGFNACWVPGTDHASIATEAKVVRLLREQGINKREIGREKFLEHAFEWKEKYGGIILQQLRKLGASCDWDRTSFTMDPHYSKEVIMTFVDMYNKGYIYRGLRMVNWDVIARTAVSDEEVIYKEKNGKLYHIRYAVEGTDKWITIATTRPETILGDTAISVHPEDERYTDLVGKKALVPLLNRAIPIIADDYVDREFGTGALKVTPAHDTNDYEIGKRHKLETIDILNEDGTLSEAAQLYIGEDRFAVRKQISKDLEASGNLVETEDYRNSIGHSERTDAVIEPRLSLQWFLKMDEVSKPALDAVVNGEVNLIPEKFTNTYRHWMENVRDWCLSRQLWWGHQIPAYFIKGDQDSYVVAETPEEALQLAITKTGDSSLTMNDLHQDEDVLDTWASSWLWPISVFKGLSDPDNEEINYYYPTNDLVTAPEILFFWVARMIIAGKEYRNEIPFKNVYLTGIVRDKQRRKMSKSLGNSPNPLDLIHDFGADGVRVGMMLSSPAGNDLLFDEGLVEQGRNYANKVWNAFRLVMGWETHDNGATELDHLAIKWMESRIDEAGHILEDQYDKFRLSDALMTLYKLIWDDFSGWYLEMVKPPFGEPISAETLEATKGLLERLMKLLHPFMPFLTEEIYQRMSERDEKDFICVSDMPRPGEADQNLLKRFALAQEMTTEGRKFRQQNSLSPKESIDIHIKTADQTAFDGIMPVLTKFLNANISFTDEAIAGAGSFRIGTHELFVPAAAVDSDAERTKIEEEIKYQEGFLNIVRKKLGNERFVQNAPDQVVASERKKEASALAKLEVLKEQLARL